MLKWILASLAIAVVAAVAFSGHSGPVVAQKIRFITGECSDLDPDDFETIAGFRDAVVAAADGFGSAGAEAQTLACAETLQLAAELRDIANSPVVLALGDLKKVCKDSGGSPRTCGVLRELLDKAILSTSKDRRGDFLEDRSPRRRF